MARSTRKRMAPLQLANNRVEPARLFLRSSGHPDLTVRSVKDAKTRT